MDLGSCCAFRSSAIKGGTVEGASNGVLGSKEGVGGGEVLVDEMKEVVDDEELWCISLS